MWAAFEEELIEVAPLVLLVLTAATFVPSVVKIPGDVAAMVMVPLAEGFAPLVTTMALFGPIPAAYGI
jgi:hypothetical protein